MSPHYSILYTDENICKEAVFKFLLSLERKRTERTKQPFTLLKLHVRKVLDEDSGHKTLKKITRILATATRETDIKGWFDEGSIIGIILTDIDPAGTGILIQKITSGLHGVPGLLDDGKIRITYRAFPSDVGIAGEDKSAQMTFYSELMKLRSSRKAALAVKRCLDVVGSIVAFIVFSPFFILIPILIKLTSAGPVLFRQERFGQFGKKFVFLKFRSMYVNNDPAIHREYVKRLICDKAVDAVEESDDGEKPVYKIKDDPRVTPLGRFLRKSSLDEIPQFINVLKGEMALVGPRPPIDYEIANYETWHNRRVLEVKPGITGLWQVKGRSRTSFDDMVRLDIQYVNCWSVWLDIKLIFQTLWVVVRGSGGY